MTAGAHHEIDGAADADLDSCITSLLTFSTDTSAALGQQRALAQRILADIHGSPCHMAERVGRRFRRAAHHVESALDEVVAELRRCGRRD